MKNLVLLTAFAVLFTSCRQSLNGQYKVDPIMIPIASNDSSNNASLRHILENTQYDLTIDSEFASLTSLRTHESLKLHRLKAVKHLSYEGTTKNGSQQVNVLLVRDTSFTMEVILRSVANPALIAQSPANNILATSKMAKVKCYLTRMD